METETTGGSFSSSEIVDIARQIEAAGEAFYGAALEHLKDPAIRSVFAFLRNEEKLHAEIFEKLLAEIGEDRGEWRQDPEYLAYLRALGDLRVFPHPGAARARVEELPDEPAAVRYALGFEKDSILFLHELRSLVRKESRGIIDQLIAEEQSHVLSLIQLLAPAEESAPGRRRSRAPDPPR